MVDHISPFRANPKVDPHPRTDKAGPTNPPPRGDEFRKSMKDGRPKKDEEELASVSAVEEHEEPPSLFDLSKSARSKSKSSLTKQSSLKDSSASQSTTNRSTPTVKQYPDEGPDSSLPETLETTKSEPETAMPEMPLLLEEPVEGTWQEGQTAQSPDPQDTPSPANQPQKTMETMKHQQVAATPSQKTTETLKHQQIAATPLPPQKTKRVSKEESSFETNSLGQTPKKQKTDKIEKSRSEGTEEVKGEMMGSVNASIQSVNFQTEKPQEGQPTISSATVRELAAQIIDRIEIMRRGDETQTTLTLRHPPILEGSTITLTATEHAKREFNIAFANLSPDAKLFLDRKLRENSLTETLERKGITVHMLTTTTQAEQPIRTDAGQTFRDRQEQQQQQQQQHRQQRPQGSEEEENIF